MESACDVKKIQTLFQNVLQTLWLLLCILFNVRGIFIVGVHLTIAVVPIMIIVMIASVVVSISSAKRHKPISAIFRWCYTI